MRIIRFIANDEDAFNYHNYPKPAKQKIPFWYKSLKRYRSKENSPSIWISPDGTVMKNTLLKSCMPFRDAMTAGYTWSLPTDLVIKKINGIIDVYWLSHGKIIDIQGGEDFPPLHNNNLDKKTYSFNCNFRIETPKNYSVLFTHPLNRHDLPFRTFSGIVENDKYNLPVNFPFQIIVDLNEGESIIVEKDTPVVQFIPIKRERWFIKKLKDTNETDKQKRINNIWSNISHAYRNNFWVRKHYE